MHTAVSRICQEGDLLSVSRATVKLTFTYRCTTLHGESGRQRDGRADEPRRGVKCTYLRLEALLLHLKLTSGSRLSLILVTNLTLEADE